ncbi:hypothetical protein [Jatrophihabitans fulvus]
MTQPTVQSPSAPIADQYGPTQQYGQYDQQYDRYEQQYAAAPGYPQPQPRAHRGFGISAGVAVIGAAGVAAAFTVLQWFRNDYKSLGGGASDATFGDVHDALDKISSQADGSPFANLIDTGMAPAYFSWLGWALLTAAVVATAIAVSPLGTDIARGVGALVGLAGVVLTALNLQLFTVSDELAKLSKDTPTGYLDWVKHSSFGAWAAVGGFLVLGVAAAVGPRRVRS